MYHKYQNLIDQLEAEGYLKTPEIIAAFRHIKRTDFVLPGLEHESHYNFPLLIGYGQTISQPATVAFMLELLQPKVGEKILDVGFGSACAKGAGHCQSD
jgi:protein-L-isoaspartate(D-aspartate) O-methyltransferase